MVSSATYEAYEHSQRDERVACALLRCTEATPVCWEPALTPEQDPTDVGAGAQFGYNVSAGTGCFVDAALLDGWSQAWEARAAPSLAMMHKAAWLALAPTPACFSVPGR